MLSCRWRGGVAPKSLEKLICISGLGYVQRHARTPSRGNLVRDYGTESIIVILYADALASIDPSIIRRGYFYSSSLVTDQEVPFCLESKVSSLPKFRENIRILQEEGKIIENLLLPENRPLNRVLFRQIIGSLPVLTEYHAVYDEGNTGIRRQVIRRKVVIDGRFVANCFEFVVSRRNLCVVIATTDEGVKQIIGTTLNSLRMMNSMSSQEVEKSNDSLLKHLCENLRIYVLSDMSLLFADPSALRGWISGQR